MHDDFTFLDLVQAYKDCRRHKRYTPNALDFEFNLEKNLVQLYEDLKSGAYKIGPSECFIVLKPKPREVWAASFRDRVVHHLVYNAVFPRFYKRFITDTYSCIPDRGALNGARRLAGYIRAATDNYSKTAYFLKADIKNFFVSIDKNILFNLLSAHVHEKWLLSLLHKIVFDNPREHVFIKSPKTKFDKLPQYKSLWFTPDDKGLPIGNLTSQFFSNVYLDVMDQFIKRTLKCRYYCRYVDDFVIIDPSPEKLNRCHKAVTDFIKSSLALDLHQNKKLIAKTSQGVDFVGYTIKYNRISLRCRTLKRIYSLFHSMSAADFSKTDNLSLLCSLNSYMGFLQCTDSFRIRKDLCRLAAGSFIDSDKQFSKFFFPDMVIA